MWELGLSHRSGTVYEIRTAGDCPIWCYLELSKHVPSVFRSGRRGESLELEKLMLTGWESELLECLDFKEMSSSPHGDTCEGTVGGSYLKRRRMNSQLRAFCEESALRGGGL